MLKLGELRECLQEQRSMMHNGLNKLAYSFSQMEDMSFEALEDGNISLTLMAHISQPSGVAVVRTRVKSYEASGGRLPIRNLKGSGRFLNEDRTSTFRYYSRPGGT